MVTVHQLFVPTKVTKSQLRKHRIIAYLNSSMDTNQENSSASDHEDAWTSFRKQDVPPVPAERPFSALTAALLAEASTGPSSAIGAAEPDPIPDVEAPDYTFTGDFDPGRPLSAGGKKSEGLTREYCTGQPPKEKFLTADGPVGQREKPAPQPNHADEPELDNVVKSSKLYIESHYYFPLTRDAVWALDPFLNGEKPIINMSLFDRIVIARGTNEVHADHVLAVLEKIGEHCKHLVIQTPVKTSEYGQIFYRDPEDIDCTNDWDTIFKCVPNVQRVTYLHWDGEYVNSYRGTFYDIGCAIKRRQAAEEPKSFELKAPIGLLTDVDHDTILA
ncbi:hypothetical protein ACEQ8H_006854 [Pleosporales sp. CAS-2024a]